MAEIICVVCPKGCRLSVDEKNDYRVAGHGCERGIEYGRMEISDPRRVVTSTVRITGAAHRRCPVRTSAAVPKGLMLEAVRLLDAVELASPVREGDIVIENILGTGIDFIATRDM